MQIKNKFYLDIKAHRERFERSKPLLVALLESVWLTNAYRCVYY